MNELPEIDHRREALCQVELPLHQEPTPGPHAILVTIAGMTICRQRPGTANLFIPKTTFHRLRGVITGEPFLQVEGILQRSEGDQPTVYVLHIEPLSGIDPEHTARSHDFH